MPPCSYRVSVKALVLNDARDRFLVCREANGFWELPGGGLEWDSTPHEALVRELSEEMGLSPTKVAEHPSYMVTGRRNDDPNTHIINVVYECELEHLNFTPSDECVETEFVNSVTVSDIKAFDSVIKLAHCFRPERHQK